MQLTVNNTACEVPYSLMTIKLDDYLRYHDEYGRELNKSLTAILEKKYREDEELDKLVALEEYLDNEALAWNSFWTGFDLFEVRNDPHIVTPIFEAHRKRRHLIKPIQDESLVFPLKINWKGETWVVNDYKVTGNTQIVFNEIVTSKETIRQIFSIGKDRIDALPYLCGIFFRKKGEKFSDKLVEEGSERMELLKTLPLKYAFQVAFFLTSCVNIWKNISVCSADMDQEIPSLN